MELWYALFILLLYIGLVLLGVWLYEYLEKRKAYNKPVRMNLLSNREKNAKLNEFIAPLGFAYDVRQDIFYSRMDAWQRKAGYGRLFDEGAAPLNMIIDCEPISFEYGGQSWLIEFWKGQYGITTGGEVGVYYLPREDRVEQSLFHDLTYQCVKDEDTLRIRTTLWKRGRQLFYRKGYHWWLTGFVLGEFSRPADLEMDIEITFPDAVMRDAFLQGLYRAGYRNEELSARDNTVWVHFAKPHTKQPLTRTRLFSAVKQWENKRNCHLFHRVTKSSTNVYDKLLALQVRAPGLYRKMEKISRGRLEPEGRMK